MQHKSGEWLWIAASAELSRNAAGEPVRMMGSHIDITTRKQAEAERTRLAAIVENSNDAIFSRSLEGVILTWNAGAEKLLGYTAAEAIGRVSDFLVPTYRKPNRAANIEVLLGGAKVKRETDRLTKDGRVISVLSSHSPIKDAHGKLIGESIILQDISALKQAQAAAKESQERTNGIIESAMDSIISVDSQQHIVLFNAAAEKLFGYRAEDVIGQPLDRLIPARFRPQHHHHIETFGATGISTRSMGKLTPIGGLHADGWEFPIEASISQTGAGAYKLFTVIMRDITERKQAEATRASLEAQLRESQKMQAIGTLAGGIAHDFNNALATILGNAELARQDSAHNPPALESLEEIRKAGTRARNLVQQILSFSRRQPTERKPIDLAPVVTEATRLLRATLPARLSLEVRCDDVPLVLADMSQIEQVLINLATNAMQAMHNGPGRISIRLDTVPLDAAITGTHLGLQAMRARHPERTLRITVSDTGPGMDAATKERVFEPFFTTKPVDEGTGLGLSVVHGIVQGHEGAITVDSEPGKGTTFTIYLPVAEGEVGASTQPVDPGTETGPPALSLDGGPRILYLDDDESLVFLVDRLLKRRGYRITAYTRQDEALQALRAEPAAFDLVLTDYNMPGMSGLDVAREVRALNPNLPVAVTSGFIDEALRAQAEGAGVREVIFKADSVEVFCDAVQRLVQAVRQKTT